MLFCPLDTFDALEVRWARRGLLMAFLFLSGEGDGIRDVSSRRLSVKNSALGGVGCLPVKVEPTARECSGLFSFCRDIASRIKDVSRVVLFDP